MATVARQIEILEYKISEIDNRLIVFEAQGISSRRMTKLSSKKSMYEGQLAVLQG